MVSALLVEPALPEALSICTTLAESGFEVTIAETFLQAKERLSARSPAVLITEVRLSEYNGLHLVVRGRSLRPALAALVMSPVPDPVLQADAEALGATFLVKPVVDRDLVAAVFRTLFQSRDTSWSPSRIAPPFERRLTQRRTDATSILFDRRISERRRDRPTLLQLVGQSGP